MHKRNRRIKEIAARGHENGNYATLPWIPLHEVRMSKGDLTSRLVRVYSLSEAAHQAGGYANPYPGSPDLSSNTIVVEFLGLLAHLDHWIEPHQDVNEGPEKWKRALGLVIVVTLMYCDLVRISFGHTNFFEIIKYVKRWKLVHWSQDVPCMGFQPIVGLGMSGNIFYSSLTCEP